MHSQTEISYKRAAIEGASPIGLMIVLFDALVKDLRRAASALHENDIELRCKELNHAALVLGRLESWVDRKAGGESAETLSRFYSYLRAKMTEAAVTKSAKPLESLIEMILHVRTAWQLLDSTPSEEAIKLSPATSDQASSAYASAEAVPDRIPFSQSA